MSFVTLAAEAVAIDGDSKVEGLGKGFKKKNLTFCFNFEMGSKICFSLIRVESILTEDGIFKF